MKYFNLIGGGFQFSKSSTTGKVPKKRGRKPKNSVNTISRPYHPQIAQSKPSAIIITQPRLKAAIRLIGLSDNAVSRMILSTWVKSVISVTAFDRFSKTLHKSSPYEGHVGDGANLSTSILL